MADLTAGSTIKALDWPPTQTNYDATSQLNQTSTSYITGSPEVGVTFIAPTTGRVEVTVSAGIRDNAGTPANQGIVSFQMFENNSGGTEVEAPSADNAVRSGESIYSSASRSKIISGLTPGGTYYARCQHRVDGGTSVDIGYREITVKPVS